MLCPPNCAHSPFSLSRLRLLPLLKHAVPPVTGQFLHMSENATRVALHTCRRVNMPFHYRSNMPLCKPAIHLATGQSQHVSWQFETGQKQERTCRCLNMPATRVGKLHLRGTSVLIKMQVSIYASMCTYHQTAKSLQRVHRPTMSASHA